mgnify:FL=1
MNLHDLFEKKANTPDDNEHEQSIDIRDPATKWLVKKARAKYAYAETDLEAFVQFMRDEVDAEKENIQANTDGIEHEAEVNVTQQQGIDKSKEVNIAQEKHLKRLDAKEKQIDNKLAQFDAVKLDIEMQMKKRDEATLNKDTIQIGR